jgi:hypothetical protein
MDKPVGKLQVGPVEVVAVPKARAFNKSWPSYPTTINFLLDKLEIDLKRVLSPFLPGCQFFPPGEYLRFVRVPETLPKGSEVLVVEVHPRRNLTIQPVEKVLYFNFIVFI